nr:hypothetical protein CFP56_52437 [Quercus suber]
MEWWPVRYLRTPQHELSLQTLTKTNPRTPFFYRCCKTPRRRSESVLAQRHRALVSSRQIQPSSCIRLHDHSPFMLHIAVHDVHQPLLDQPGIHPAVAIQGEVDVLPAEMNLAHRGDEEGRARREGFHDPALARGFQQFGDGEPPLHHLQSFESVGRPGREALFRDLQDRGAGDAFEDDHLRQWGGDQLRSPRLLVLEDHEEVARAGLGHEALVTEQPEHLIEPPGSGFALGDEAGPIVCADLGVAEPSRPGPNGVFGRRQQSQSLPRLPSTRGPVQRRRCTRRLETFGHVRETRQDDIQQRLRRPLHAQRGIRRDHRRPDVEERARALPGQPLVAVLRAQRHDHLLERGGVEVRQRDARRRAPHALRVPPSAEQPQLPVEAAVQLEALEALGRVVQHRRRRHDGQRPVRPQLRRLPPALRRPPRRHHVVRADLLRQHLGAVRRRRRARLRRQRHVHVRGIERRLVRGLRHGVLDAGLGERGRARWGRRARGRRGECGGRHFCWWLAMGERSAGLGSFRRPLVETSNS